MNWFHAELILSKNDKNKFNNFLNNLKNIISDKNFQNLFEFKGISLWNTISPVFKMMSFSPYLPSYYDFLVSLDNLFKEKKPKMIFLSYETGPYGLAILLAAKKNGIKTVGVAHATIDKYNPMYSYNYNTDHYNPPYKQPRVEVKGKEHEERTEDCDMCNGTGIDQ